MGFKYNLKIFWTIVISGQHLVKCLQDHRSLFNLFMPVVIRKTEMKLNLINIYIIRIYKEVLRSNLCHLISMILLDYLVKR